MAANTPGMAPAQSYAGSQRRKGSRVPTLAWLILLLAALAGGFYLGHFVFLEPINFGTLGGQTTIKEDDLDRVVATYTYDGEVYEVTAREAIAQGSSLEAVRVSEGTYSMPSAENVLSAARTAILMREVEVRGIKVTDDELVAYALENFGTDDLASLAGMYTMDQETLRARLRESACIARLREEVVGDASEASDVPAEPTAPENGDVKSSSADYAAYIIALAGEEWDSEQNAWAAPDGPFASALRDFDISDESATYEAAQTAYNVAYQLHGSDATSASSKWTAYVNGLLSQTHLALGSIVS